MRILHVIPAIAARYGGPSSVIRSLCGALARRPGLQVEVLTTDADGAGQRLNSADLPDDFPVHVCSRGFSERWKYSRELTIWCDNHVGQFDLVHIHAVWSHAALAAARAAFRHAVPYIIRPAGMLSPYSFSNRPGWKRLYWHLAERRTALRAAMFHATAAAEAADIRTLVPDADVTVIPNGVENSAWSMTHEPDWLRRQLNLQHCSRPLLLFLSRLHPKKGVTDVLLPALARLADRPRLVIAGGTDAHAPDYESQIRRQIRALGLTDDVILVGAVAPADRWRWLDGADAFVLPSHSENFGIVVAEAMARACPVIITDQVQSCDHVLQAGAGLVVRTDPADWVTALGQVMRSSEQLRRWGESGREYAARNFQWQEIAGQVERMYQAVRTSAVLPHRHPATADQSMTPR